MKIRTVKKFSRIARENPERFKNCHYQYCLRSWLQNVGRSNVYLKYALRHGMSRSTQLQQFGKLLEGKKAFSTKKVQNRTVLLDSLEPAINI